MVSLEEVANFERAKRGKVYPAGVSTLQISATRGQIGYLKRPGEVADKCAIIIPLPNINPRYFNIALEQGIGGFMARYATGLNIKLEDIGRFSLKLHSSRRTQDAIVQLVDYMDKQLGIELEELAALGNLKSTMLDEMMV